MKSSFRWYGESDPVKLEYIRQIPGMRSIVSAVYDVKPGEVWPEESIRHLTELCREHGLIFDVVESIPVTEEIKLGNRKESSIFKITANLSVVVQSMELSVLRIILCRYLTGQEHSLTNGRGRFNQSCHVLGADERAGPVKR